MAAILIPVGFHYFHVLIRLSYVGSDASQLSLPVLVVRAYERRVVSRVKRSASTVCHALWVSLWVLGVPFVDCTGVPHRYCMLLWYLLCYGTSRPSPVEVLALSLILLVTLCGLWSLAKIYFCRVVGMIIRWALVNIPSSLAIWCLKGQFGFKSVECCWMWISQPSLIISFNAPRFASKLLCPSTFCNILLQAEGRPREFGHSFRGWVHDFLLIMLTEHQLLQFLCLVGYECWGHMVATLAASAEDAEEELSGF